MMARAPETDTPRRKKGNAAQIAVYGLLALLVLGLGGFGIQDYGNRIASIGSVGDRDIRTDDYARALQGQIDNLSQQIGQPANLAMLQAFGLDQQALQGLVNRVAIDAEAERIGLSVGDEIVAQEVQAMGSFQGVDGQFDATAYRDILRRDGRTVVQFEDGLREDIARSLLQGAIAGGFAAPEPMTETLYQWVGERRGFTVLRLTEGDLATPLPVPVEADLTAFHTANIAQFTAPEAKRITYVALLPEMISADVAVDEAALRAEYDKRIAEFVQPERRLVERLIFPDNAAAAAAKARIDAGGGFEDEVTRRDVRLEDIDLGDVSRDELGAAGDAIFALAEPGVLGPLPTDLGPALFRMNGVLGAQEITFDEAREQLAGEAQLEAARREIAGRIEAIDDALAGGATLADVAAKQGMNLGTFDYVTGSQGDEPIEGYEDFRAAADAVTTDSYPEVIRLADGGIAALQLDEVVPPAPIPFADARTGVQAAWRADALQKALSARAIEVKSAVEGGAAIGSFGIVNVTTEIAREGFIEGTPPSVVAAAFALDEGAVRVIEEPGFVAVLHLDRIIPAATEGDDATAIRQALAAQIEQAIAQDAFLAYTTALSSAPGAVQIDQQAIAAVQANFN
jgi:peptidyl-prolyl cis-trans isomerase D